MGGRLLSSVPLRHLLVSCKSNKAMTYLDPSVVVHTLVHVDQVPCTSSAVDVPAVNLDEPSSALAWGLGIQSHQLEVAWIHYDAGTLDWVRGRTLASVDSSAGSSEHCRKVQMNVDGSSCDLPFVARSVAYTVNHQPTLDACSSDDHLEAYHILAWAVDTSAWAADPAHCSTDPWGAEMAALKIVKLKTACGDHQSEEAR